MSSAFKHQIRAFLDTISMVSVVGSNRERRELLGVSLRPALYPAIADGVRHCHAADPALGSCHVKTSRPRRDKRAGQLSVLEGERKNLLRLEIPIKRRRSQRR